VSSPQQLFVPSMEQQILIHARCAVVTGSSGAAASFIVRSLYR
jgi:hypothetical protein